MFFSPSCPRLLSFQPTHTPSLSRPVRLAGTDTITVQPMDGSKTIEAPFDSVFPAEEEGAAFVDDNCGLMFLNEGTMLHNLKLRYKEDFIYTYTANILLALNPYFRLPM